MGVTQFVEHHLYVLLTLLLSPEEDDDVVSVEEKCWKVVPARQHYFKLHKA